jgi:hypothetical protein
MKFDPTPDPWTMATITRETAIDVLQKSGDFVTVIGKVIEGRTWEIVALLPHQGERNARDESNAELVMLAGTIGAGIRKAEVLD